MALVERFPLTVKPPMLVEGELDYTVVGNRIVLGVSGLAKAVAEVIGNGGATAFTTGVGELKFGLTANGPWYSFSSAVTLTGPGVTSVVNIAGYPYVAWEVTTAEGDVPAATVRIYAEGEVTS